jgi:hypothetical protein
VKQGEKEAVLLQRVVAIFILRAERDSYQNVCGLKIEIAGISYTVYSICYEMVCQTETRLNASFPTQDSVHKHIQGFYKRSIHLQYL